MPAEETPALSPQSGARQLPGWRKALLFGAVLIVGGTAGHFLGRPEVLASRSVQREPQTAQGAPTGQENVEDWTQVVRREKEAGLRRAMAAFAALVNGPEKTKLLHTIASDGALVDRKATLDFIEGLRGTPFWKEALRDTIYILASSDPEGALSLSTQLGASADYLAAMNDVLTLAADTRPAWALERAVQMPASSEKNQALAEIAQVYAERDFTAAQQALNLLPAGGAKNSLTAAVASTLAQRDPAEAARQFLSIGSGLPDLVEREIANRLLSAWVNTDPRAASEWLTKIENPSTRRRGYESYIDVLSRTDPKGAAAFVERLAASGEGNLSSAAAMAARGLAADSPHDAAEWLLKFEWTPIVEKEFSYSVLRWAKTEPASVVSYLSKMSIPAQRDQAGAASALALASEDGDLALDVSKTISDRAVRERTVAKIRQIRSSLEPAARKTR